MISHFLELIVASHWRSCNNCYCHLKQVSQCAFGGEWHLGIIATEGGGKLEIGRPENPSHRPLGATHVGLAGSMCALANFGVDMGDCGKEYAPVYRLTRGDLPQKPTCAALFEGLVGIPVGNDSRRTEIGGVGDDAGGAVDYCGDGCFGVRSDAGAPFAVTWWSGSHHSPQSRKSRYRSHLEPEGVGTVPHHHSNQSVGWTIGNCLGQTPVGGEN